MEHQNPRVTAIGHQTIMPYLIVENASAFIDFVKIVFEMELQSITNRPDGSVLHAELRREGSTIMLSDATTEYPAMPAGLFIYIDNTDETYELALELGAISVQPPSDQNYGRAAGVLDAWGNTWWITSITTRKVS
ncbi:MAG: VOC family protein [Saprospiraceae bacterium]